MKVHIYVINHLLLFLKTSNLFRLSTHNTWKMAIAQLQEVARYMHLSENIVAYEWGLFPLGTVSRGLCLFGVVFHWINKKKL